jgi:hypothetical protein
MKLSHFIRRSSTVVCSVWFLALGWGSFGALGASTAEREAEFYPLITVPIPEGIVLEAGAIAALPNQRLAISTRLGDIYFVDGAFQNPPAKAKFTRFASGLHEVLGLFQGKDGWFYATQRGEITRLRDTDGDGRADEFETFADGWGIGGDYHEYAFGSKPDRDGNIWVVLCLTGSFTSENEFRGWALRVTPEGKVIPSASGIRSPGGIATNHLGDMFYTDNQGPWNGTCWLKPLVPGGFNGNPSGFKWYSLATNLGPAPKEPSSNSRIAAERAKMKEFVPPAIGFPYNKMGQSASGIANDFSGGKFGPFANQLFVGDQTWSTVMRVYLEKVNGVYQGACFPFREGLDSGTLSLEFAADGSLFAGGTDRGWGARGGKPFALQRIVWSGRTPFEIHEMHAEPDGFELTFTEPVDPGTAGDVAAYTFENYTYIYQASYGSPEVDREKPPIESATVGADGRSVRLKVKLTPGHIHELKLPGVKSAQGKPLLHTEAYYWLNEIPTREPR